MMLGTNPFCMAAPAGKHRPIILDMSPAVAARGKIRRARAARRENPARLRAGCQGKPTTDPTAALAGGVVLPIGEHKGSGLSHVHGYFRRRDLGRRGSAASVGDQAKAFDRPQDVGHFFLAMKPNLFVSEDEYRARMDTLIERVRAAPRAEGFDEILLPGEPEDRIEAERRKTGIPYAASEVAALQDEAKKAGVQPLVVSDRPIVLRTQP